MSKRQRRTTSFVDEGPNEYLKGQRFGLQVKLPPLFDEKSAYQQVQVFQTVAHGKCLVLDGVVQLTESDEFAYHEMIAHVPMFSCKAKNPKRVLVIGAGDGGVIRELVKHAKILKEIVQIEIDKLVVNTCTSHLPTVSNGAFDHPKLKLRIDDGLAYVRSQKSKFDVIIVDSSDPSQGPNGPLFDIEFYKHLRRLLRDDRSVVCVQAEHPWYYQDFLTVIAKKLASAFDKQVQYFGTQVPTYPGGYIGFFLCRTSGHAESAASYDQEGDEQILESCKYYTRDVHQASFILPKFIKDMLDSAISMG